jgi:hypothetical protein
MATWPCPFPPRAMRRPLERAAVPVRENSPSRANNNVEKMPGFTFVRVLPRVPRRTAGPGLMR